MKWIGKDRKIDAMFVNFAREGSSEEAAACRD
jgi:hypothetical protein